MNEIYLLIGLIGFGSLMTLWFMSVRSRGQALARVAGASQTTSPVSSDRRPSAMRMKLIRAGFRRREALRTFVMVAALTPLIGLFVAAWYYNSDLRIDLLAGVDAAPSGLRAPIAIALDIAPLFILLVISLIPWLYLRSVRRRRVAAISQSLPLALELFASLAEAGLGFDASAERLVAVRDADDVFAEELREYRRSLIAGVARVRSLRLLGDRVALPELSIFVSALVQADQVGSSIADTLRKQADDMRSRRRQEADAKARALPVKLVVPLVVCFLPAIFVVTLGPAFKQLFEILDSITR